jgi:uncharacterized membrane protein
MEVTKPRLQRAVLAAVLTFGLTALVAVLPGPEFLVPAVAVTGWFVLTPLLAVGLLPGVEFEDERSPSSSDPLTSLQERYATGEISEAEFERRVERIVETDEASDDTDDAIERDLDLETERELERER